MFKNKKQKMNKNLFKKFKLKYYISIIQATKYINYKNILNKIYTILINLNLLKYIKLLLYY